MKAVAGTAPAPANTRTRLAVAISSSAASPAFVSPGQRGQTATNSYDFASIPPVAGDDPVNMRDPSGRVAIDATSAELMSLAIYGDSAHDQDVESALAPMPKWTAQSQIAATEEVPPDKSTERCTPPDDIHNCYLVYTPMYYLLKNTTANTYASTQAAVEIVYLNLYGFESFSDFEDNVFPDNGLPGEGDNGNHFTSSTDNSINWWITQESFSGGLSAIWTFVVDLYQHVLSYESNSPGPTTPWKIYRQLACLSSSGGGTVA